MLSKINREKIDIRSTKEINYKADVKQFNKYKEILGEELPNTVEEFQKLKYNDSEEWEELKSAKQDILNKMDFKDMGNLVGTLGDKEVRIWYDTHDKNILI